MQQPNQTQPNTNFTSTLYVPDIIRASDKADCMMSIHKRLAEKAPRVHCLTNAVTMNDVANILLAIGGSAIMAQCGAEVEQITGLCHATLLNTGTPSDEKFAACCFAGARANALGHPVVLDPVGVGASTYRQENIRELLFKVHPDLIRCNLEEALTLLALSGEAIIYEESSRNQITLLALAEEPVKADQSGNSEKSRLPHQQMLDSAGNNKDSKPENILPHCTAHMPEFTEIDNGSTPGNEPIHTIPAIKTTLHEIRHGGVESGINADISTCADTAAQLARTYRTSVLISGQVDAISNGRDTVLVTGGDTRMTRITGSGCMLSAICAALLVTRENGFDAALDAALFWKQAAECAGKKTDACSGGMGSFRMFLFDAVTNPGSMPEMEASLNCGI